MSGSLRCVWPAWIQGRTGVVFSRFNWWLNIPVATKFLQLVCGSSGGAYVVVQGLIWWDMPDQTWSASLDTVFWSTSTTAMPRTRREDSMYLVIHQAQVGKPWGLHVFQHVWRSHRSHTWHFCPQPLVTVSAPDIAPSPGGEGPGDEATLDSVHSKPHSV